MTKKILMFLFPSFLIMFIMGTVYTWSVFRPVVENEYEVNTLLSGFPYMISLFFYAFGVMIMGRKLTKQNTRKVALIGSILIGTGWILSSFTTNIFLLTLTYGVLIGLGVGIIYGIPLFIIQQLYSSKSGLYTGIVLFGFGLSPIFSAPLARTLIQHFSLHQAFLILGIGFLLLLIPLTQVFKVKSDQEFVLNKETISLKTGPFKGLFLLFFLSTSIGLMMIGLSYQIGVNYYHFTPVSVTVLVSSFALMNGISRPIFGFIMDKKGFKFSSILSLLLIAFGAIIALSNHGKSEVLYAISYGLFWFNLGAWLAIAPQAVKEFYGVKNYAQVYGKVFSAYGFAGIIGVLISGPILDYFGDTSYLYVGILLILIITFVVLLFFTKKYHKARE